MLGVLVVLEVVELEVLDDCMRLEKELRLSDFLGGISSEGF